MIMILMTIVRKKHHKIDIELDNIESNIKDKAII